MAQFSLPENSKIIKGDYYKDNTGSNNIKKVRDDLLKMRNFIELKNWKNPSSPLGSSPICSNLDFINSAAQFSPSDPTSHPSKLSSYKEKITNLIQYYVQEYDIIVLI